MTRHSHRVLLASVWSLVALSLGRPATGNSEETQTSVPGGASGYSAHGADTCLECHADPDVLGIFRTAHARPQDIRGPFGHGGLQCEACHGPGDAHVKAHRRDKRALIIDFGAGAHTPVAQQNAMCLGCHQPNAAHDWAASVHAANNVACVDCHRLHQPEDPVRSVAAQGAVCGKCHQLQRMSMWQSSGHPMREGKMACTACHSPHGSSAVASLVKDTVNATCTSCHAEYRGPFLWEHQPVTEDCTNCHEPHGSAQPAMLKARPPFLCQQCHEAQGHPSALNGPQGLPNAIPSPMLLGGSCLNCHSQIHGSNHPSGRALMR